MQQNSNIFDKDKKAYEQEIKTAENKIPIQILCSFAYLTPNYSVLFTLNELKRITDSSNFRVFIIFWDMNTLVHPYFKKAVSNGKITDPEKYIQDKMSELKKIAESIGFDTNKITIYKSSDLWKRLIAYKEENLFQDFYSVLSELKVQDFMKNIKVSNLLQIPMDIFFANYFDKLFPEDTPRPIEMIFSSKNKIVIYDMTRKQMHENGLIKFKRPLFMLMEDFPYLMYKSYVPEWNMSLKEINNIVSNISLTKRDIIALSRNLGLNKSSSQKDLVNKGYKKSSNDMSIEKLKGHTSEELFDYLKESKKRYNSIIEEIEEPIINIYKKEKLKEIGQVIKSDIALNIILLADGTNNTTDISKILKKSIATISTYTNKLKKLNLIRVLPNNKLKRNLKGIKVNFELGIE